MRSWRTAALTGSVSPVPLAVLFGLNLVDEFDRVAFAALTPEIRDAFSLSDAAIGTIGVGSGVFVLLAALPAGFLGDRFNRVRISAASAVLWGAMSVLTGVVPTVALLVIVRMLAGLGPIVNEVVHPSLLADYYPPSAHPRVFQVHRMANPVSAMSGIVAGYLGAVVGWRWTFVVLSIPTALLISSLLRLREPIRGESIDADLAAQVAATEGPVPFGEARRQLMAVRSLRRLWLAGFAAGIGFLAVNQFFSLFFEKVYGYGPLGRGFVQFVDGAGIVAGLVIGGRMAGRAAARDDMGRLAVVVGLGFVEFGIGLIVMALLPWAWASTAAVFFLAIGVGAFQPAFFALVGLIAPPRIRAQAYGYSIVFVGLGGFASVPLFSLGETQGYRTAIVVLAAIIVVAGAVAMSASSFVPRDRDRATDTMHTALRIRDAFAASSGTKPILVCGSVDVAYGGVQVLFGVDVQVAEGEIVALLGTNGAGKSTLLNAVSGLVEPSGGSIFFAQRDITYADAEQTSRMGIVQVPGGRGVFGDLSVARNLDLATWTHGRDRASARRSTDEVLDRFPSLRDRLDTAAGQLSGGEQQMLTLGQALIARPRLLLIDELTLGLAPVVVADLLGAVEALNAQGTSVVLVEQSVNVALSVAERAYFLDKGEVRFDGPAAELLERPDVLRAVFLEGAAR